LPHVISQEGLIHRRSDGEHEDPAATTTSYKPPAATAAYEDPATAASAHEQDLQDLPQPDIHNKHRPSLTNKTKTTPIMLDEEKEGSG
jgi:hypothetical protein